MKQIQVTVPAGDGAELVKSLNEIVSPSQINLIKGNDTSLLLITVSPYRTSFVLHHLNELGIGRVKGRITITDVDATIPRIRPRKQDKFLRRISIEELEQNVGSLTKFNFNYVSFIILSSILAAMGLISDDNITILAAMIISPLMGPIVGIAFGAVASNQKILKEGFLAEGVGTLISVLIGFIIGLVYRATLDEPSAFIVARGEPNIVNLIIAIISGITAGICFVSGTSLALVGVAAAATLLPVAVNTGIALGLFEWRIALGSFVIFITNVACVHLGCLIIFWIRKVEPPQAVKKVRAKRSLRLQILAFGLILLVVAVPIVQTSLQIVRKWKYQRITNEVANEMLKPLDGVVFPPEELDVIIYGGLFTNYQVNITIRLLSTQPLPNATYTAVKQAIENRANHPIESLKLEVILFQDFGSLAKILNTQPGVMLNSLRMITLDRRIILG
ncbi:MAG: TIGR00341 family protein [Asgard group archaeon]|nr:TIGR00341 family protein [Asgard group archaeon]